MIAGPWRTHIQQEKHSYLTTPLHVSLPWLAVWWELPTRKWFVTVDTLEFRSCLVSLDLSRLRQSGVYLPYLASFLLNVLKRTMIPVAIDDISKKAQGTWEQLIIRHNNTACGTRAYRVEHLCTLPLVSTNGTFQVEMEEHSHIAYSISEAQRWAQCNTPVQWTSPDQG